MKIVVTGGLGHIGSKVIRELPLFFPSSEIVIVDNMATQRYASLFDLTKNARYRFIEGDVTSIDLRPVFADADAVIHLAALTDAAASFDHPEAMERVNYTATKQVAEACSAVGVPMIHASSTSIYGTGKDTVDENCSPDELVPQSPYAETKRREEILVAEMCQGGRLNAMTFRFGTIFGTSPGMRFHTAVNKFCWQAVMGLPLTVWKTAYEQRRPYLDLDDAVRAIAFVIENKMFDGNIYNAVTSNATVREVIDIIQQHIPTLKVNFVESRIMNTLSYEVINTRLHAKGFDMRGDLGAGVKATLKMLMNANTRDS